MWRSELTGVTTVAPSTEHPSRQMAGTGEQIAGNDACVRGENCAFPIRLARRGGRTSFVARVSAQPFDDNYEHEACLVPPFPLQLDSHLHAG